MARIIMQPSGKSVDCAYGDTVLMALEKAGYALPNNCRAGACGECKVKVTQGQFDQGMVLDMALSRRSASQGYGLMCMAKPISDELTIEWGTEDAKPKLFPPREDALFVVTDKKPSPPASSSCACARSASRSATGPASTSPSATRAPTSRPAPIPFPTPRARTANWCCRWPAPTAA
jgi:ferredoxin